MSKPLVINADNFGYSVERNNGMVNCFLHGAISGVTMMVNGVAAEDAANRAKKATCQQTMRSDMTIDRLQRQLAKAFKCNGREVISCDLMVHPGYRSGDVGGCGIGVDDFARSEQREREISVLQSKEMQEFYRTQGIKVVPFQRCYSYM